MFICVHRWLISLFDEACQRAVLQGGRTGARGRRRKPRPGRADPHETYEGRDRQLDTAIRTLLDKLAQEPVQPLVPMAVPPLR